MAISPFSPSVVPGSHWCTADDGAVRRGEPFVPARPAQKGVTMGLGDIVNKAKSALGGDRSAGDAKEDALEVKDTATSDESMTEKAKEGYEEIKDPGAPG